MKYLKYFLLTMITVFTLSCTSCGSKKTLTEPSYTVSVTSVKNLGTDTLTVMQLDSWTKAANLPSYSKWNKSYMRDGETNKAYEYATIYDKTTGLIYTVKYLQDKSCYVVQKRKTSSK